jgi:hypothetical protein
MFDFVHLENFVAAGGFPGAENRKNEAVFRDFFRNGHVLRNFLCYEIHRKNPFG